MATAAVGPITSGAPANVSPPTVTGTAMEGQTLTASNGGWNNTPTSYTYQWQRSTDNGLSWTPIAGATAGTYVLAAADIGAIVRVNVTAANSYGSASSANAGTGAIVSGAPHSTAAPTVAGTPQQGQVLTASTGTWSPAGTTYGYQWQRSSDGGQTWNAIPGATSSTYTPAAADIGSNVRVTLTATNPLGATNVSSNALGPVASGAPFSTSAPLINGAAHQAQVLTVNASWNPAGTSYSYQWQRSSDNGVTWSNIAGGTGSSYTLGVADESALVRVSVSASNPYGQASATSGSIGPVTAAPAVNVVAPVLTGTAQRTNTLSASQGTWSGPSLAYSYQWQHSSDGGDTWTAIPGAIGTSYILGIADEGTSVRVLVTATNLDGAVSQPSIATNVVAPYPPSNSAAPTIVGIAQRTYTLAASTGTWVGPGITYAYQWQQDLGDGYEDIDGATDPTYTLATGDEGSTVRVLVTATNLDGSIVQASQPTTPVLSALPVNTTLPVVTGPLQRDSTLSSVLGMWIGSSNNYAYQWQRSADGTTWSSIAGATSSSYVLTPADEGSHVRLLVTATNADGTGSAASVETALVQSAPPVNTGVPTIGAAAQRGSILLASQGSWSGIGNVYTYQWQRATGVGFTDIPGATGANYTLAVADEGAAVRVVITAANVDGTLSVPSVASATVQAAPPVNTAAPVLSGTAARASILTSSRGIWGGVGNAYSYQWQRSADGTTWTNIAGATAATYMLAVADEQDHVRALVTATNADQSLSASTVATAAIPSAPPVSTAAPVLTGVVQRDSLLGATQGSWNGIGNAYSYQWQRSADGTTWTNIAGATAATYMLAVDDEHDQAACARDRHESRRHPQRRKRPDDDCTERPAGQHGRTGAVGNCSARIGAERDAGDVDGDRQRLLISVAALGGRHDLVEHRRRDQFDIHGRRRR